jgi:hypothetical protein
MAKATFHGVLNRRAQCGNDAKRRVSIAELLALGDRSTRGVPEWELLVYTRQFS